MIYLDHAAATPLDPRVKEAMEPFFSEQFFNPSAAYFAAKKVREVYDDAKNRLAHVIGAKGNDLIITAGATEANNLAFNLNFKNLKKLTPENKTPQILVLETEHDSVRGLDFKEFEVEFIKVLPSGIIDLEDFKSKITDETVLVSVAAANNEIGSIQPLSDISEILKTIRTERMKRGLRLPIFLHSDASQALSLMDISVSRLGVDMMTINSAKIYGPKGVGALYVSHDVLSFLKPIIYGGGQEKGLRAGTENVPGVIGFSCAAEICHNHISSARKKYARFNEIFREVLGTAKVEPKFLGGKKKLDNFCSVSFPGIDAERIIFMLEDEEIYLSTGAACAANKGQKSRTLTAIGLSSEEIAGSLRISFGETNSEEDIKIAAEKIVAAVNAEFNRTSGRF